MKRIFLACLLICFCFFTLHGQTIRYYAPHVTAQPPWLNKLAVFNNGDTETAFTVIIFHANGAIAFQESYNVSGNSSLVLVLPTEAGYAPEAGEIVLDPLEGSLMVETESEKIRPKASFRYGDSPSLTEFFLQETMAWEYILPNSILSHFSWTGVAILNPHDEQLDVKLQAYQNGVVVGETDQAIDPRTKYVNLADWIWNKIGYTEFDQIRISTVDQAFPPPMSITGNDEQDRHVFFNGAPTAFSRQGGTLYATDSIAGDLMLVSAGTFVQGREPGDLCDESDETPFTHELTLDIAVMATEVTRQMWADLKARQSSLPSDPTDTLYGSGMNNPVQNVTWHETVLFANLLSVEQGLTPCYYTDASFTTPVVIGNYTTDLIYCDWNANGFRLLAEGEWEYSCRAGTTTTFSVAEPNFISCDEYCTLGNLPSLESVAWFCANENERSQPVANKLANPWGLYNMHGNVREWCWDRYDSIYPSGSATDYRGPFPGSTSRVIRDCSWGNSADHCRSAYRGRNIPDTRYEKCGFRLCRKID